MGKEIGSKPWWDVDKVVGVEPGDTFIRNDTGIGITFTYVKTIVKDGKEYALMEVSLRDIKPIAVSTRELARWVDWKEQMFS
jgi:hypothetical protein